jgi:hypothetical protein
MADKKKEGKAVETLLNYLHKNHISLQDDDIKRTGEHFRKVLACFEGLFLGGFAKLRKVTTSFVMSVCPHGTTRLPLDGF